jgi:hypothetical protein
MRILRRIPLIPTSYKAVYPPAYNSTYVKATTNTFEMEPHKALDPSQPLSGDAYPYCWMSNVGNPTSQRFHVDFGAAKSIGKIEYCNYHNAGYNTNRGAQSFTLQGSNTAGSFAELTYATDTGWTTIAKSPASLVRHTETYDGNITNTITITSPAAYRYYALKLASNYGDGSYLGIRRLKFYEASY